MAANGIDDKLSQNEVNEIVRQTLKSANFNLIDYGLTPASDNPLGFLGDHQKLKVEYREIGKDGTEKRQYFVKTIPSSVPQHMKYALGTRAFYKEIELYKTLFEDIRNVHDAEKWCPEYYYSRGEELFVVEDLSAEGYRMLPERMPMDEAHVRASLRAVATMHAGSFVLQEKLRRGCAGSLSKNYEEYRNKPDVTLGELYGHLTYETEVSDEKGHPGNDFMEVGFRSQTPLVDILDGYTEQEKEKIREELPGVLRRIFPLVKPSTKYENIFIHGDLWSNNLLFRKNEDNTVDAIIIDFQLARYGPPAHDLMMFLYLVQNREFRMKKEKQLLDYYYQLLSNELSKNGISVEDVLPKDVFLDSCEFYRELGIVSAVLYFQLILASPEAVSKFMASPESYEHVMFVDRSEVIIDCFKRDAMFRERMASAMDELIGEYILKKNTKK